MTVLVDGRSRCQLGRAERYISPRSGACTTFPRPRAKRDKEVWGLGIVDSVPVKLPCLEPLISPGQETSGT